MNVKRVFDGGGFPMFTSYHDYRLPFKLVGPLNTDNVQFRRTLRRISLKHSSGIPLGAISQHSRCGRSRPRWRMVVLELKDLFGTTTRITECCNWSVRTTTVGYTTMVGDLRLAAGRRNCTDCCYMAGSRRFAVLSVGCRHPPLALPVAQIVRRSDGNGTGRVFATRVRLVGGPDLTCHAAVGGSGASDCRTETGPWRGPSLRPGALSHASNNYVRRLEECKMTICMSQSARPRDEVLQIMLRFTKRGAQRTVPGLRAPTWTRRTPAGCSQCSTSVPRVSRAQLVTLSILFLMFPVFLVVEDMAITRPLRPYGSWRKSRTLGTQRIH